MAGTGEPIESWQEALNRWEASLPEEGQIAHADAARQFLKAWATDPVPAKGDLRKDAAFQRRIREIFTDRLTSAGLPREFAWAYIGDALRLVLSVEPALAAAEARSIAADPVGAKSIEETAAKFRKSGLWSQETGLLILVVLAWLLAVVLPMAETELPVKDQTVVTNEVATVGLALAITDHLRRNKDKKS